MRLAHHPRGALRVGALLMCGCALPPPPGSEYRAPPDVAAPTLMQRSCAGTPTPAGCGIVPIIGGTFTMGSNVDCNAMSGNPACVYNGSPEQTNVRVGNFAVDAYEVTVARFNVYWAARMSEMATVRSAPIRYRHQSIAWQPPPHAEPLR